jgi:hypothetical protein
VHPRAPPKIEKNKIFWGKIVISPPAVGAIRVDHLFLIVVLSYYMSLRSEFRVVLSYYMSLRSECTICVGHHYAQINTNNVSKT